MQPPQLPFPRTPLCLGLIVAQSISFDTQTGILSIIGPYSKIDSAFFPVTYLSMEVFVVLTECDGDVLVELRLVDVPDFRPPLFRHLLSAHFNGPTDVQELVFHQFNVTIPAEDNYSLQLYVHGPGLPVAAQGVFVVERRLVVSQVEEG